MYRNPIYTYATVKLTVSMNLKMYCVGVKFPEIFSCTVKTRITYSRMVFTLWWTTEEKEKNSLHPEPIYH